MNRKPAPGSGSSPLTVGQVRLLARHRRGLLRLAQVLAAKSGVCPADLMFVLANSQSQFASAVRELFPNTLRVKEAVIIPGLAKELAKWIERLAVSGPVWNSTASSEGIPVILIDDENTMALVRIGP
jgi:hypothetical protein